MEPKEKEASLLDAATFRELSYASAGVKVTLKGIEKVEEKDAYVVEYVTPLGAKISDYYDVQTGLKVQTVTMQKGPQGETAVPVRYSDYKDVSGVKIPHTVTQVAGPMTFKFVLQSVEVNPKLDDAAFKM
jgi:hypothetical protein